MTDQKIDSCYSVRPKGFVVVICVVEPTILLLKLTFKLQNAD